MSGSGIDEALQAVSEGLRSKKDKRRTEEDALLPLHEEMKQKYELKKKIEETEAVVRALKEKYRRLYARDYQRRETIDWEDNDARVERLNESIRQSGLTRTEIAAYAGISRGYLSAVLGPKREAPLGRKLELRIAKALRDLVEKRRIDTHIALTRKPR